MAVHDCSPSAAFFCKMTQRHEYAKPPGPENGACDELAFSAHESSRVVRSVPPQACDRFRQFDDKERQHEPHHRHCRNQISPDVEGVGSGRGYDRSCPHHDHNSCTLGEPKTSTPRNSHHPEYDDDSEGDGQGPAQIGGAAWEI